MLNLTTRLKITALAMMGSATLLAKALAAEPVDLPPPTMMDGLGVYSFMAGDLVGRFCFGEADNHFASVFILLYNAGKASITVTPDSVHLIDSADAEKARWEPSAYVKHLQTPRSWLGIATLLATPDGQIASLHTDYSPYYAPTVTTRERTQTSGDTVDRGKSTTLTLFGQKKADLFWAAVKSAPIASEDMLLRSTTLVPRSAIFGAIPFAAKVNSSSKYVVELTFSDPPQRTGVKPRE